MVSSTWSHRGHLSGWSNPCLANWSGGDPWFLPLDHIEDISPGGPIHALLISQLSNISVGLLTK
jgi:hypothetical protein